ncbi:MAG: PIN domain-containing protein [Lewinellaceae bacterium]|nr:PIN domain-containing protein [Lewinellaceae bacterium]
MNFLWDTNILLHCVRRSVKYNELNQTHNFFASGNQVFLSVITIGEIESIAYQRNWSQAKWNELQLVVGATSLLSIYEEVIHAYARIDAFSQGKRFGQPLPIGVSARNMGKNDLWLAATAHVGKFIFVTTDLDFNHLDGVFLDLLKV